MGILNLTPDSFSDGGEHDPGSARSRLDELMAEGASVVDVGAESTRPGAPDVSADEQLRRLAPLLDALAGGSVPFSIDTSSAGVASTALDAGAVLVNDVRAGLADPDLLPLVAERGAAVCLTHMRGTPADMQDDPRYADVVGEVERFLGDRRTAALEAGVGPDRVLVDPGIGFGKTLEHNLALLAAVGRFARLGPVVVGVSRKGMFGQLLGRSVDERLAGSLSAALAAVAEGASVIRAHDVAATVDALRTWRAIGDAGRSHG